MVQYQDDGSVLIIAGNIPGMRGYFKNYPEVVENDPQLEQEHELAQQRLERALEVLEEYDPQPSYHKANSGNGSLRDIYFTVSRSQRDDAILQVWKVLNYLRDDYIGYLEENEPEKYGDYEQLSDEILTITKQVADRHKLAA